MLDNFWIILVFPLLGAAVNGILGKRLSPGLIAVFGCGSVLLSFLVAFVSFVQLVGLSPDQRHVTAYLFVWIEAGDFISEASFLFDPLSAVMILVVTARGTT